MSIWDYTESLPNQPAAEFRISLGEGRTPLIRSRSIGPSMGAERLYFKLETSNPTGSYKDRFAAAAVSHLAADHAMLCLGCSSGNTGAALAAYSAAIGIPCILAIVDSAPEAKLRQMQIYGARLVRLKGFGTDAEVTRDVASGLVRLATDLGTVVQISAFSHTPKGMAGVQSLSLELAESGMGISSVFCPAGGGGLTLAVARGFTGSGAQPAVHCVQPEGNDTIATRLREGFDTALPCKCTTVISGLQVANVMDGTETIAACRASGGTGHTVSDEFVFEVQARLALEEGVFAEPAGAVAVAGAIKAIKRQEVDATANIVCLVTGSGFKDDASQSRLVSSSIDCVRADSFEAFERIVLNSLDRS